MTAVICVLLSTVVVVAAVVPIYTVQPLTKSVPVSVIVPPLALETFPSLLVILGTSFTPLPVGPLGPVGPSKPRGLCQAVPL